MRIKSLQDLPEASRKVNPQLFGQVQEKRSVVIPDKNVPLPYKETTRKRIRQDSKPLLNKLETEFYNWLRESCSYNQIILQAMRFKLGNGIWYKPDFIVFTSTRAIDAYEVKGPHAFRGGLENLKVAASLYPEIEWFLVWKENNTWQEQRVLP